MKIEFTIPAVPVAQPRPRASSFGGNVRVHEVTSIKTKDGRKPHPIVHFKATVAMAASAAYRDTPLTVPVTVDVECVFPRQKNKIWKTRPMPRYPHVTKPDRDNLDKAILDAITGIVLADDKQAFDGRVSKWHAAGDEQPHCRVTVQTLDP